MQKGLKIKKWRKQNTKQNLKIKRNICYINFSEGFVFKHEDAVKNFEQYVPSGQSSSSNVDFTKFIVLAELQKKPSNVFFVFQRSQ